MPRFVIKLEKHGHQVRVTIPKEMVDDMGLKRIAYGLMWAINDKSIVLVPFLDEVMLNEAISGDRDIRDTRSKTP